jgi:hypothetical protein
MIIDCKKHLCHPTACMDEEIRTGKLLQSIILKITACDGTISPSRLTRDFILIDRRIP